MHLCWANTISAILNSPWQLTSTPPRLAKTFRGHLRRPEQHILNFGRRSQTQRPVVRGMTHDGLGKYLSQVIEKRPAPPLILPKLTRNQDRSRHQLPARRLRDGNPGGTLNRSSKQAAPSSTAFPSLIASSEYWGKRFEDAGLPILGDDIKSQIGATILHRQLATSSSTVA